MTELERQTDSLAKRYRNFSEKEITPTDGEFRAAVRLLNATVNFMEMKKPFDKLAEISEELLHDNGD